MEHLQRPTYCLRRVCVPGTSNMLLQRRLEAATDEAATHSARHMRDVSSSVLRSADRVVKESSGSDSECANHRPLDVTRAVGECSMTDDGDGAGRILYGLDTQSSWSAEDLKLEMDVLEAEYNLLRVRKALAVKNTSNGRVGKNNAAPQTQALCMSRVHPIPREHSCPVHSSFQPGCKDAWDKLNRFGTTPVPKDTICDNLFKDKKCLNDSAAHREELDLRPLKDEQADVAHALQKEENCYCFGRRSQQTLAEEMYCKEAIRRIVQQVEAEIEQWSQMQDLLRNLQREFEGLSEWQKLWEDRALRAESQLKCLQEEVHKWRCRAQSTKEELVMLRCEKQILKNQINMIEDAQMNISGTVQEVVEKPRCASVGMQHEDFAVCESFVHSRNESGRSSVDLGTKSTQRSFRKSIKKSLDFVSGSKNSSNSSKFLFGNLGVPKGGPPGLEFSSKKVDMADTSKGKPKSIKTSGQFIKLNTTKPDSSESTCGHDHKERKKARIFASSKESRLFSESFSALHASISENAQDGLPLGRVVNLLGQDYTGGLFSTNPKSSWPSAPQSTPSRIPFGEIVNFSKNVKQ